MFCITCLSLGVKAQTYTYNVGEKRDLPTPTPPAGYVDHIGVGKCTNKNDCVTVDGLSVYVHKFFSGTATIEVEYNYTWTYNGKRQVDNGTAYYSVECKPTTVTLNKSEVEINVGEEIELTYKTTPPNLTPLVTWTTSDKTVAHLSDDNHWGNDKITNSKTITVTGNGEGTCTIKCEGNTGKTAPTCIVKVIDMNWVKADVPSGEVDKGTKVTLTCKKSGATIYYTIDGSEPTKSSIKYTSPIIINESLTLKAKAYLGDKESSVLTRKYVIFKYKPGEIVKAKTREGVEMSFKAVKSKSGDALFFIVSGGENRTAIDKSYSGTITIPKQVEGISVTDIDEKAFCGCNISSFVLPDNIGFYTIGKNAFQDCKNLTSVTIPEDMIATIEKEAFMNCTGITTINFLRWNIHEIGEKAFYNCTNIKTINSYIYQKIPKINDNVFYATTDIYKNAILYVKKGYVNDYKSTAGWKNFQNIKEIGSDDIIKVSNITLDQEELTLQVGKTYTLSATVLPNNATNKTVKWSSSNNNVATVNESSGLVTAKTSGTSTITCEAKDGSGVKATCKVTVTSTPKLKLSADPSGGSVEKGTKVTLTAKADGSTISSVDIYYTLSGSNPTKSSTKYSSSGIIINEACMLKAIAYRDGYEDSDILTESYTIKSVEPIGITVSPNSKTITVGGTFTPTYTLSPSNATTTVKWSSENSSIASVNENTGVVKGIKAGTTKIWAKTSNNKSDYCTVTVEDNVVYVTSITIKDTKYDGLLPIKGTTQLSATVYPSNATNKSVTWESDKENVVTVNSSGKLTANSEGAAQITCKSNDGSGVYATYTVYVDNGEIPEIIWGKGDGYSYSTSETVEKGQKIHLMALDGFELFIGSCTYYYTLDGSTPTKSSPHFTSNGYESNSTIVINETCTLKAFAIREGYKDSKVKTWSFTVGGNYKDGDVFISKTIEGIDMTFTVISASEKTCKLGDSSYNSCIKGNTKSHVTIPSVVNGMTVTTIGYGAFSECYYIPSLTIPSTITTIEDDFYKCDSLVNIYISDIVSWCNIDFESIIDNNIHLFIDGEELKDLVVPDVIENIKDGSFYRCVGLERLSLGSNVKSIGLMAFAGCSGLKTISIGENVRAIDDWAFLNCNNLCEINSYSYNPPIIKEGDFSFPFVSRYEEDWSYPCINGDVILYVPKGCKDIYQKANGWRYFKNIVEFDPSGINDAKSDGTKNEYIYNLFGRRLDQPRKGINIIEGKKVVVK